MFPTCKNDLRAYDLEKYGTAELSNISEQDKKKNVWLIAIFLGLFLSLHRKGALNSEDKLRWSLLSRFMRCELTTSASPRYCLRASVENRMKRSHFSPFEKSQSRTWEAVHVAVRQPCNERTQNVLSNQKTEYADAKICAVPCDAFTRAKSNAFEVDRHREFKAGPADHLNKTAVNSGSAGAGRRAREARAFERAAGA
jgi:hypothetical protein